MSIRLNGKIIAGNSKSTYTGFEIGDIGISSLGIDENQNRRRYLNGQIIISEQFVAFTEKLKSASALHPTLICTEEEWQTTSSLSVGGQCGKFVMDDEAGTIRLPRIIMPIQGLTDLNKLAEIVEAGLPNITGSISNALLGNGGVGQDAFRSSVGSGSLGASGADTSRLSLTLDASLSNDIYGNSDTVQQEQIQYPYFIQVSTGCDEGINTIREIELTNPFVLLEPRFFETEVYNVSWLLANGTYNGSNVVHPSAYQALLVENNAEVAIGSTATLSIGTEYTKRGLSVKLSTDNDITDYDFVVNTSDETFRLPIKVNLASGKAVIGNGMTLGLTNGTQNLGMYAGNSNFGNSLVSNTGTTYGSPVGSTRDSNGTANTTLATVGITTDPTKSGIETSDSDLYLYFYVGETVQNANLINAGRIEEKIASLIPDNADMINGFGLPDYANAIQNLGLPTTVYGSNTAQFIAPSDGLVRLNAIKTTSAGSMYLRVNGNIADYIGSAYTTMATVLRAWVNKGDVITLTTDVTSSSSPFNTAGQFFFPLKGAN